MSTIACACGRTFEQPPDSRRFRCPSCPRIYDPRSLGWHPPQEGVAQPGDIEAQGMDRPMNEYPVDWSYKPEDMERIRWGMRRRSMEDKWFLCVTENELRCHRSWTGVLCYKASLHEGGVDRIHIMRDMPDHPWQLKMLKWILESRLIGLDVPAP